jgi:hypothetical protein
MSVDDEILIAFVDGELGADERAAVEAALEQDAALRARIAAHRQLRSRLSVAFDGVLSEPIPARLAEQTQVQTAEVVTLADRRSRRWSAREWGAMAASVAAGLLIGAGAMNVERPIIAAAEGGLVARGALARALDSQLASEASGNVRIGLSFQSQDGAYCRTFSVTRSDTSGLACRDSDAWAIAMTAQGGGGEVRMAGASEAILDAVDSMIVGEPLDQAAERQARDLGWR